MLTILVWLLFFRLVAAQGDCLHTIVSGNTIGYHNLPPEFDWEVLTPINASLNCTEACCVDDRCNYALIHSGNGSDACVLLKCPPTVCSRYYAQDGSSQLVLFERNSSATSTDSTTVIPMTDKTSTSVTTTTTLPSSLTTFDNSTSTASAESAETTNETASSTTSTASTTLMTSSSSSEAAPTGTTSQVSADHVSEMNQTEASSQATSASSQTTTSTDDAALVTQPQNPSSTETTVQQLSAATSTTSLAASQPESSTTSTLSSSKATTTSVSTNSATSTQTSSTQHAVNTTETQTTSNIQHNNSRINGTATNMSIYMEASLQEIPFSRLKPMYAVLSCVTLCIFVVTVGMVCKNAIMLWRRRHYQRISFVLNELYE